jgi:ABC-type amino acid transport substrate-binding protein
MFKRINAFLLILVALSLVLASCAPAVAPAPDPVTVSVVETQIVEREVVVTVVVEGETKEIVITATPAPTDIPRPVKKVASNAQIALRIYKEGNEVKGYEYDLYKEALNRAGYEVELVDVAFAGIFAGLLAEKWDMACSNIFITMQRAEEMDFTEPFNEGFDVAVAKKSSDVQSLSDFQGKVIGSETGTSQAAWLAGMNTEYGPFQTQLYEDAETQWLDLDNGRISALTTSFITAVLKIKDNPDLQIIAESDDNFMVGCFLRKGDPLKAEMDTALQSMKEDGTLAALYEQYFGTKPPADSAIVNIFTEPHVPTR